MPSLGEWVIKPFKHIGLQLLTAKLMLRARSRYGAAVQCWKTTSVLKSVALATTSEKWILSYHSTFCVFCVLESASISNQASMSTIGPRALDFVSNERSQTNMHSMKVRGELTFFTNFLSIGAQKYHGELPAYLHFHMDVRVRSCVFDVTFHLSHTN